MSEPRAPAQPDSRRRALLLLAIVVTLVTWASAFAAIRHAVRGFSPGALALVRFATASVTLALLVVPTGLLARGARLRRGDVAGFLVVGLVAVAIYHVALNAGQRTVGAGAASLLINTGPIWTAFLAIGFLGERLDARGWVGIALAFVGCAVISVGAAGGVRFEGDVGLVLIAAICQALFFVFQKRLMRRYGPLESTCYMVWLGTLFLLPFIPQAVRGVREASGPEILSALYLGVVPGAIGYLTWTYVLSRMPASRAATLLYMVPPLAYLIGWIALGEVPGISALIGGVPILAGVALVNAGRQPSSARAGI